MSLVNSSKLNKSSKAPPTSVSSAANSLASFVDSGLRWTETPGVLDLSDDQQQPRPPSKAAEPAVRAVETPVVKESVPKVEETEDQESLLQRDLAMVLEEISQITRLADQVPTSQNQQSQMAKASDSRTKSVIKWTGSMSSSQLSTSVPVLTPNPPSRPLTASGSSLPPKLTAATRTPPPLAVSTSVSRISSSPTGSNTSVNMISPTQTHSSRTISPVSSDHLKSGRIKKQVWLIIFRYFWDIGLLLQVQDMANTIRASAKCLPTNSWLHPQLILLADMVEISTPRIILVRRRGNLKQDHLNNRYHHFLLISSMLVPIWFRGAHPTPFLGIEYIR